jgi:hypothetical protein
MMNSRWVEELTGALSIPKLVGRKEIVALIRESVLDPYPRLHILFLNGEGGIGKTRLLQEGLKHAQEAEKVRSVRTILDLYHVSLHTTLGLMEAIYKALTPPLDCLKEYNLAYQALNRMRLVGEVGSVSEQRLRVQQAFDADIVDLCAKRRVVLALDTAERAAYGLPTWTNPVPLALSIEWLLENLEKWTNVTLLIAGRSNAKPLLQSLQKQYAKSVNVIQVGNFTLEESLEYFDAVQALAKNKGKNKVAERLSKLPLDVKKLAHEYAQGKPILLSLLADFLSVAGPGQLPASLKKTQPLSLSEEERHTFEKELINRLFESHYGDTLRALGRTPKGMDQRLLASILDITIEEAKKLLNELLDLSFVKQRPRDERLFLHDEMYTLLQRHVYDYPEDALAAFHAFSTIKTYYDQKQENNIVRFEKLYEPVEIYGRERLDLDILIEAHTERQEILTEKMFYFLSHDLGRGFRHYYRYSQEAILSNDILMDMQLEAELLDFLATRSLPKSNGRLGDELSLPLLQAILHLRPIVRLWAENKYEEAYQTAEHLQEELEELWSKEARPALAALHSWAAYAHVMRGWGEDFTAAKVHFQEVLALFSNKAIFLDQGVEVAVESTGDAWSVTEMWYIKAILALTYRVYGYFQRLRDSSQESIEHFRKAVALSRQVDVRIELATAYNDLGFALANQGFLQDGRALVENALNLRHELGHLPLVAFSLSTLALIDVFEGQNTSAQQHAERALAIFHAFSIERGIGMALTTIAEARRRYAAATPLLDVDNRVNLLRQASADASDAAKIFEDKERFRQVAALIEVGCACRDWVRIRRDNPNPRDNRHRLIEESEFALRQGAEIALKENIPYLEIDSRVNLAWLWYYLLDKDEKVDESHSLSRAIQEAKDAIPKDLLDEQSASSKEGEYPQLAIWTRIGKLFVLEGHLAFHRLELASKEERKNFTIGKNVTYPIQALLEDIAEFYGRGLDYNARYASDHQGIRRAKEEIYGRVILLNDAEISVVCEKIRALFPNGSVIEELLRNRVLWRQ